MERVYGLAKLSAWSCKAKHSAKLRVNPPFHFFVISLRFGFRLPFIGKQGEGKAGNALPAPYRFPAGQGPDPPLQRLPEAEA